MTFATVIAMTNMCHQECNGVGCCIKRVVYKKILYNTKMALTSIITLANAGGRIGSQ